MCKRCKRWNYEVSDGVLIKRARYSTNHFHQEKAWAFDAVIIDKHLPTVTHVTVIEPDTGRRWRISAQIFWKEMQSRYDTNNDLQYFVEDKHWDLFDPRTPDGKPLQTIPKTRSKLPPPNLQPRLM